MLRVNTGLSEDQKFVFACLHCPAILRGKLHLDYEKIEKQWKSEDVEICIEGVQIESLPSYTLCSDLPVHISCQGKSMAGGGSPFLYLMQLMSSEGFLQYKIQVDALHDIRSRYFPQIRRCFSAYLVGDYVKILAIAKDLRAEDLLKEDPKYIFHRLIQVIFVPILDMDIKVAVSKEMYGDLVGCRASYHESYALLLHEFYEDDIFKAHIKSTLDLLVRLMDKYDALIPALAYEALLDKSSAAIGDLRIHRDDFDELKALYVDLFEVSSRGLAYMGMVANLARRGNAQMWANGKKMSLSECLKLRSVQREFIVQEMPETAKLYKQLKRNARNDFGHFKVQLDVHTGYLENENGSREHFIIFLADLLGAARVLSHLLTFTEKISLDYGK